MTVSRTVNKVVRIFTVPCVPAPQIWIECAAPAAINAFWSLLPVDKKSIIRLATGKTWLKHVKQALSDVRVTAPVFYDGALTTLFEIVELEDMAVWYLFLAEVGLDFLAEWTSLVYKMGGCTQAKREATMVAKGGDGGTAQHRVWGLAISRRTIFPTVGVLVSSDIIVPAGTQATIACTQGNSSPTGPEYGHSLRLINKSTGAQIAISSVSQEEASNGRVCIVFANVVADLFLDTTFELQCRWDSDTGTFWFMGGGTLTVYTGAVNDWYGHM